MSCRSQRANNATSSANAIALASASRADTSFWTSDCPSGRATFGSGLLSLELGRAAMVSVARFSGTDQGPTSYNAWKHHRAGTPGRPRGVRRGARGEIGEWWPWGAKPARPVPAAGLPQVSGVAMLSDSAIRGWRHRPKTIRPLEIYEEADEDSGGSLLVG